MTAPLDEKGLIAAAKALINADPTMHGHHQSHIEAKMPYASVSVAAYLAASPSPSEMEFTHVAKTKLDGLLADGWQVNGYSIQKDDRIGLVTTGAFVGWYSNACEAMNTAEAQVLRLTEANEAILGDFATTAFELEAAEARIKALEEALRPFANEADQWEEFEDSEALVEGWNGGPASSVNVGSLRSARTALKENAQ